MKTTQIRNGKSFEYALAIALGDATKIPIENNGEFALAAACFKCQTDGHEEILEHAAKEAVNFLVENDERISHCTNISLQKDSCGKTGDARDIVIRVKNGEIGISAKKNHSAIKHSRLSQSIDFGNVWTGFPCNKSYFDAIEPTFEELKRLCGEKLLFKDILRKPETIYLPIIAAFEDELRALTSQHGTEFVKKLFEYMIGKHDFYKVMVFSEGKAVKIQSVNINGTLEWGAKWAIPDTIFTIRRTKSFNRIEVTFSGGWSMSFRIHSAKNEVEPSLKFDINFVGMPPYVGQHEIPLL